MEISGNKIRLRPAQESDRKKIYTWLAHSDLTTSMMGPPDYSDHPIPTWEEFCKDYTLSFFNDSGNGKGRNYILIAHDEEVGMIGYDLLDKKKDRVVLDIWLRAERYCGLGYGSDALNILCVYLHETFGITNFITSPSARNKRAIAAYGKAGFKCAAKIGREQQRKEFGKDEYEDNIIMIKNLITNQSSELGTAAARRLPIADF